MCRAPRRNSERGERLDEGLAITLWRYRGRGAVSISRVDAAAVRACDVVVVVGVLTVRRSSMVGRRTGARRGNKRFLNAIPDARSISEPRALLPWRCVRERIKTLNDVGREMAIGKPTQLLLERPTLCRWCTARVHSAGKACSQLH
jgi:hypothetical protein